MYANSPGTVQVYTNSPGTVQIYTNSHLMCWLPLLWCWPQPWCCCSAWRYPAVAGTSPSAGPPDQPGPVQYSSQLREGATGEEDLQHCTDTVCVHVLVRACVLYSPCLLSVTMAEEVVGQGHRPEHVMVSSFPVRHACCSSLHWNTQIRTHTNTHTHKNRDNEEEKGNE